MANKLEIIQCTKSGDINLRSYVTLDYAARDFRHLMPSSASLILHRCGDHEYIAHYINYDFFKIGGY